MSAFYVGQRVKGVGRYDGSSGLPPDFFVGREGTVIEIGAIPCEGILLPLAVDFDGHGEVGCNWWDVVPLTLLFDPEVERQAEIA